MWDLATLQRLNREAAMRSVTLEQIAEWRTKFNLDNHFDSDDDIRGYIVDQDFDEQDYS